VLSSNESVFKNVRYNNEGDPAGKSSEAFYIDEKNNVHHQNPIFNYSSDQNLLDRRPFTSGNDHGHGANRELLQMRISEEGRLGTAEEMQNTRKAGRQNMYLQSQASKSMNKGCKRPSNMLPPAVPRG
jgi:hypothetical protein